MENWDVTKRLHEIKGLALIIVGEHDELVPALSEDMHREIPDSHLAVFHGGSHLLMFEESEKHVNTIADSFWNSGSPRIRLNVTQDSDLVYV
jgi:pimeloyl-ACP methyl ester carboxylesterase